MMHPPRASLERLAEDIRRWDETARVWADDTITREAGAAMVGLSLSAFKAFGHALGLPRRPAGDTPHKDKPQSASKKASAR